MLVGPLPLKVNTAVLCLDLGENSLGAKDVQTLAEALKLNRALLQLDLYYNQVGDDGARAFGEAIRFWRSARASGS